MKILLFFFLIFVAFNINIFSQNLTSWVNIYNGPANGSDIPSAITTDSFGNVYIIGYAKVGAGSFDVDFVTIKYDASGNTVWTKFYNGPGNGWDLGEDIAVDNLGNVYVTGRSIGDGTGWDFATIKYNSDGDEQWVVRYNHSSNGSDEPRGIVLDGDGNVYVTGRSTRLANNLNADFATVKYNSEGVEQWVDRFEGSSTDNPTALCIDDNNYIYVTGYTKTSNRGYDYLTIKYDSNGSRSWTQTYNGITGGNGNDYARDIAVDQNGNVYVTGTSFGNISDDDYLTIKYNSAGVQQWVKRYNGSSNSFDWAKSLTVDNSGNVFVTGYSTETGSGRDYTTIKYDTFGTEEWRHSYDGPGNNADEAYQIVNDNAGNVYVTGVSRGETTITNDDFATIKYNNAGEVKWIQRYNRVVASSLYSDIGRCVAVNDEGFVFVAGTSNRVNVSGEEDIVTVKYSQSIFINPLNNDKWISGESKTIKWVDQGWLAVNIKCILNYETPLQSEVVVTQNYADTLSEYQWNIPDTLLSYKSKIIVENAANPEEFIQSELFRIKPYIITKVIDNSIYQPYKFNIDRFAFRNTSSHIWPEWHTDQFDYQGTDPNTGLQYSQTVFDSIFAKTGSDSVPDWPTFVRVFGLNATYRDLENGTYNLKALTKWSKDSYTFSGVCFGFAIANANYFNNREAFLNNFPDFPDTIAVTLTSANVDSNIIKTIVELYEHQRGNPHLAYDLVKRSRLPNETIADLREMFSADNSQLRPLIFRNNNGNGGHAVLPFALEKDDSNWVIRIYDNNYSSIKNVTVYPDSANGDGKWINPDYSSWGGAEKLFLKDLAAEYLVVTPTLPKISNTNSPFSLSDSLIIISTVFSSDIIVQDDYDNITGYVNGVTYENIPNSFADVIDTGYEIPPIGFILPSDIYKIDLSNYTTDLAKLYLEKGDISFIYERSDAQSSQTDFLKFDGSLSVINPESVSKKTKVIILDSNSEEDKMFVISNLNILQTDSINISLSVDQLHLVNYGVDKAYDVGLEYAALSRSEIFSYQSILLTANTKHLLSPDWNDIQNNDLIIYVDIGNNGIIDDTLTLTNQITGLEDKSSLLSPNSFNLAQNYPNPFNPSTIIKFSLPENSMVTLKVYNIVGEELATLLNEERGRGIHSVDFDASKLSSGVYFYKIQAVPLGRQAGSFTSTKKMLMIK